MTPTARTAAYRCPPNGPTDPGVYLVLLALHDLKEGVIDHDGGCLWGIDPVKRERFRIEFGAIDELVARGWVDDSTGYDTLRVTDTGRYWLAKFVKANGGEL